LITHALVVALGPLSSGQWDLPLWCSLLNVKLAALLHIGLRVPQWRVPLPQLRQVSNWVHIEVFILRIVPWSINSHALNWLFPRLGLLERFRLKQWKVIPSVPTWPLQAILGEIKFYASLILFLDNLSWDLLNIAFPRGFPSSVGC
jgi:hypothetical protein